MVLNVSSSIGHAEENIKLRRHEKYWFDDGSLVLRVQNDLYKVHRALLHRHSRTLASLDGTTADVNGDAYKKDGAVFVHIPDELEVRSGDVEALLEYLYHDRLLDDATPFQRLAALFRVSSEKQLDFPTIHTLTRNRIEKLFSSDPEAFSRPEFAEEALALAVKYDILPIRKILFYSVATHPREAEKLEQAADGDVLITHPELSPELSARCDALLEELVSHFTPVLFTVATAGHMACTDVLAEKWMPLVIQPALDDNGLCRPLETLDRIIAIDWAAEGLCVECVKDKTQEWRCEQRGLWAKLDGWVR